MEQVACGTKHVFTLPETVWEGTTVSLSVSPFPHLQMQDVTRSLLHCGKAFAGPCQLHAGLHMAFEQLLEMCPGAESGLMKFPRSSSGSGFFCPS